jgi:hypothetical protein
VGRGERREDVSDDGDIELVEEMDTRPWTWVEAAVPKVGREELQGGTVSYSAVFGPIFRQVR